MDNEKLIEEMAKAMFPHADGNDLTIELAQNALEAIQDEGFAVVPVDAVADAIDYLLADAGAWEHGAKGNPHEVYLMHSGKLRRDIAARLRAMIAAAPNAGRG